MSLSDSPESPLSEEEFQEAKDVLDKAIKDFWAKTYPEVYIHDWVLGTRKIEGADAIDVINYTVPTKQDWLTTYTIMRINVLGYEASLTQSERS
jgi:hypothetical protein